MPAFECDATPPPTFPPPISTIRDLCIQQHFLGSAVEHCLVLMGWPLIASSALLCICIVVYGIGKGVKMM